MPTSPSLPSHRPPLPHLQRVRERKDALEDVARAQLGRRGDEHDARVAVDAPEHDVCVADLPIGGEERSEVRGVVPPVSVRTKEATHGTSRCLLSFPPPQRLTVSTFHSASSGLAASSTSRSKAE